MAVFLSRSVDGMVRRGSSPRGHEEVLDITQNANLLDVTAVVDWRSAIPRRRPRRLGALLTDGSPVSRVRASDGKLLQTWTGATNARGAGSASGRSS